MMQNIELNALNKILVPIDIVVEALEGDIYIVSLQKQNYTVRITENGEPLVTNSLEKMREKMEGIDKGSFNLIMAAPHDEMIGVAPNASQTSLMPL